MAAETTSASLPNMSPCPAQLLAMVEPSTYLLNLKLVKSDNDPHNTKVSTERPLHPGVATQAPVSSFLPKTLTHCISSVGPGCPWVHPEVARKSRWCLLGVGAES